MSGYTPAMNITGMFAIFMLFGMPLITLLLGGVVFSLYRLKSRELEVRRLEASAKLLAAGSEAPEWLENDPAALAEWKKARAELDQASVKAGLSRQAKLL